MGSTLKILAEYMMPDVTHLFTHIPPTGAVYLNDCPGQPFIPVYLLVLGAFVLLDTLLLCSPYDLTIFAEIAIIMIRIANRRKTQ